MSRNSNDQNDEIDLREIFAALWAHKLFIALTTSLFIFFTVNYSLSITKKFTAQSIFQIEKDKESTNLKGNPRIYVCLYHKGWSKICLFFVFFRFPWVPLTSPATPGPKILETSSNNKYFFEKCGNPKIGVGGSGPKGPFNPRLSSFDNALAYACA